VGHDEAEDRLASLFRAVEPPRELGAGARSRVWARLRHAARPRPKRSLGALRWAVAGVVLLTSGVVIGAMSAHRWWPRAPVTHRSPPATAARSAAGAERRGGARPGRPDAPLADSPPGFAFEPPQPHENPVMLADPPAPSGAALAARPARALRPERTNAAARAAVTAGREAPPLESAQASNPSDPETLRLESSALAGETPLLGEALTRLRQQRDASGALKVLDIYRARYPDGTLKREAEGARIDALLLLGRRGDALTELRHLELAPQGRDQELRLIRAELAAANDCAGAMTDFDRVLAEQVSDRLAERALHGRAVCRSRLGDAFGAKHDLGEYLRRFPEGRFAPDAHRALTGARDDL